MGAIKKSLRPIAPFFDLLRPFAQRHRENIFIVILKSVKSCALCAPAPLRQFSHCRENIFIVILKSVKSCALCAPAPFFVFRNKKTDTMIRLREHVYRLKRRFVFIEKVPHFCFCQLAVNVFSFFVPDVM